MTKFALIAVLVVFSTAILSDIFVSANCICPNGRTWAINNQCFCGVEADKIENCVRGIAPNWPFAGEKSSGNDIPKQLDNPDRIAENCASRSRAQSGNGNAQNGNSGSGKKPSKNVTGNGRGSGSAKPGASGGKKP
ncbi:hypothetical protein BKA69DRAFT_1126429 [Paraphysoderma sedebokerense]|nr:hypothetical protein BKA69DRAFT_1126429 [Paraphysoderma sedebokerense]